MEWLPNHRHETQIPVASCQQIVTYVFDGLRLTFGFGLAGRFILATGTSREETALRPSDSRGFFFGMRFPAGRSGLQNGHLRIRRGSCVELGVNGYAVFFGFLSICSFVAAGWHFS